MWLIEAIDKERNKESIMQSRNMWIIKSLAQYLEILEREQWVTRQLMHLN